MLQILEKMYVNILLLLIWMFCIWFCLLNNFYSEDLETVPQQLGNFIASNHYLHASELLVKSVKTIFGEDLLKVGALAELRQGLLEQRNVRDIFLMLWMVHESHLVFQLFHEVLIEKLHSNVYVKDGTPSELDDHNHGGGAHSHSLSSSTSAVPSRGR